MDNLIKYNYIEEIEEKRIKDIDGDLGHTIHIQSAIEICATIEAKYLVLLKKVFDKIK